MIRMKNNQVTENDIVVLIPVNKGSKITFKIENKSQKIHGLGVYNSSKLVGTSYGQTITLGRNKFWLLPANIMDQIDTLTRKAQIILPKDAALIVMHCDIKPGSRVVEGGLGSGALTIALLNIVGPKGAVTTYETSTTFATIGKNNIQKANLDSTWELKMQDITKGISEIDLDAVIIDIPEPWLVVDHAYNVLRPGGTFAGYTPTMNQVERLVNTLKKRHFIEIRTFETLFRNLAVGSGGTRPAFDMLGHTGYITVGRKVIEDKD